MLFLGPSTQIHFLCTLHSPTSHPISAQPPFRTLTDWRQHLEWSKAAHNLACTPVLPCGWCIISQVIQAGHWRRLSFLLPLHQELPKLNQWAVCPFSWSQFSLCSYSHQRHLCQMKPRFREFPKSVTDPDYDHRENERWKNQCREGRGNSCDHQCQAETLYQFLLSVTLCDLAQVSTPLRLSFFICKSGNRIRKRVLSTKSFWRILSALTHSSCHRFSKNNFT